MLAIGMTGFIGTRFVANDMFQKILPSGGESSGLGNPSASTPTSGTKGFPGIKPGDRRKCLGHKWLHENMPQILDGRKDYVLQAFDPQNVVTWSLFPNDPKGDFALDRTNIYTCHPGSNLYPVSVKPAPDVISRVNLPLSQKGSNGQTIGELLLASSYQPKPNNPASALPIQTELVKLLANTPYKDVEPNKLDVLVALPVTLPEDNGKYVAETVVQENPETLARIFFTVRE